LEQELDFPLRLSNVALAAKTESNERSSLILEVDGDEPIVLCSLIPGKIEQAQLDVLLDAGANVSFKVTGKNTFCLAGNFLFDSMDPSEMYGSDIDEEDMLMYDSAEEDEEIDSDMADGISDEEKIVELPENEKDVDSAVEDTEPALIPVKEEPKKKEVPEKKQLPAKKQKQEPKQEQKKNEKPAPVENKKRPFEKDAAAESEAPAQKLKKQVSFDQEAKDNEKKSAQKKTLPNGLVIEDKEAGDGARAKKGKKVDVRYIGKLQNGKIFDSNTKGKPFTFALGRGEVIKGWDMGVEGMQVGGVRKLTIPPELAYGKKGAAPDIPKNATLTFEVKLLGVK
jgi:FK506-binding nuclear protein